MMKNEKVWIYCMRIVLGMNKSIAYLNGSVPHRMTRGCRAWEDQKKLRS